MLLSIMHLRSATLVKSSPILCLPAAKLLRCDARYMNENPFKYESSTFNLVEIDVHSCEICSDFQHYLLLDQRIHSLSDRVCHFMLHFERKNELMDVHDVYSGDQQDFA